MAAWPRPLRAALATPDTVYRVEVAEHPPIFTNNGLQFSQWDAELHYASPSGGPVDGQTSVMLHGRGLRTLPSAERLQCRFGSVQT